MKDTENSARAAGVYCGLRITGLLDAALLAVPCCVLPVRICRPKA